MVTKKEILEKMQRVKTWRELGLTLQEVYDAFSADANDETKNVFVQQVADQSETVAELQQTIESLRENVKRLRSENKKLRSANQ